MASFTASAARTSFKMNDNDDFFLSHRIYLKLLSDQVKINPHMTATLQRLCQRSPTSLSFIFILKIKKF